MKTLTTMIAITFIAFTARASEQVPYIAMPVGIGYDATSLELIPVGQLEDLDRWITSWHQSSLTFAAATLLTLGFLLQLVVRFCS